MAENQLTFHFLGRTPDDWMVYINSIEEFIVWWTETHDQMVADIVNCRVDRSTLQYIELLQKNDMSEADAIAIYFERKYKGMSKSFPIYINIRGGWSTTTGLTPLKVIHAKTFPNSREHCKISQWPNGTHYYANIGCHRIVVNGREKWDSYQDAERAIEEYLN